MMYLGRNRPNRYGLIEGVLPEVAEYAAERALPIREEDDGRWNQSAVGAWLLFMMKRVRYPRIDVVLWPTQAQDPANDGFRIRRRGVWQGRAFAYHA